MEVKELVTKLGFKVDNKGINSYQAKIKALTTAAIALSAAFVAVGASVFKITRDTTKFGDELAKTSQKLGVSVESLQKLKFAGSLAGVSFGSLQNALKRFSRNIVDAKDGTETAVDAFKRLNIDPKTITNSEQAFLDVADAISKMEDGFVKTAVAQELFGRAGADLLPLFNSGSQGIKAAGVELEELGFILSTDVAKASEVFNDNLFRIGTVIEGIKFQIGAELLPVLSELVDDTLAWVKANKQLIALKIKNYLDLFIKMVKFLYGVIKSATMVFDIFAGAVGGTANALKILTATALIAGVWKLAAAIGALFAIPAAPVVGLGLLALAIDDIKTAFEGGESLALRFFSELITGSEAAAKELQTKFTTLFSAAQYIGGWSAVFESLKMMALSSFESISQYIVSLPSKAIDKLKNQFSSFVKQSSSEFKRDVLPVFAATLTIVNSIGKVFSSTWSTSLDNVKNKIAEIKSILAGSFLGKIAVDTFGGNQAPQPKIPVSPNSISSIGSIGKPSISRTSNNSNVANNFDNNFNINVTVNDKANVGQSVAEQIKLAVNNELGTQLRRTLRNAQNATV